MFAFLQARHTIIAPTVGVYELGYRSLADSITRIEPDFARLSQLAGYGE